MVSLVIDTHDIHQCIHSKCLQPVNKQTTSSLQCNNNGLDLLLRNNNISKTLYESTPSVSNDIITDNKSHFIAEEPRDINDCESRQLSIDVTQPMLNIGKLTNTSAVTSSMNSYQDDFIDSVMNGNEELGNKNNDNGINTKNSFATRPNTIPVISENEWLFHLYACITTEVVVYDSEKSTPPIMVWDEGTNRTSFKIVDITRFKNEILIAKLQGKI